MNVANANVLLVILVVVCIAQLKPDFHFCDNTKFLSKTEENA